MHYLQRNDVLSFRILGLNLLKCRVRKIRVGQAHFNKRSKKSQNSFFTQHENKIYHLISMHKVKLQCLAEQTRTLRVMHLSSSLVVLFSKVIEKAPC